MERKYFVYAYLNPRKAYINSVVAEGIEFTHEPFYIGYGQRTRHLDHMREAEMLEYHSHKLHTIRKLLAEGKHPIIVKVRESLLMTEALELEGILVKFFGKRIDGTGCLTNISDGGHVNPVLPGAANPMYGRPLSAESKRQASATYRDWWYNKASPELKAAIAKKKSKTLKDRWNNPEHKKCMLEKRELTKRNNNPEKYMRIEQKNTKIEELRKQRDVAREKRRVERESKLNLNKCTPEERAAWNKEHRGGAKNSMYGRGYKLAGKKNGRAKIIKVTILNYVFVCHGNYNSFCSEFKRFFSCNNPHRGTSFQRRYGVIIEELKTYDDIHDEFILFEGVHSFERLKHEKFEKCKDHKN